MRAAYLSWNALRRRKISACAAALRQDARVFLIACRSYPHPRAVIREHVERFNVLGGAAGHHRVDAARVVADHPAEGAAAVRCRIGAKGQAELIRRRPQAVEDDAGLYAGPAPLAVDLLDSVHVFREVEQQAIVDGLPGMPVPPPLAKIGTPRRRQAATAFNTSTASRGSTTPSGTIR